MVGLGGSGGGIAAVVRFWVGMAPALCSDSIMRFGGKT